MGKPIFQVPTRQIPVIEGTGAAFTLPWYRFFQGLAPSSSGGGVTPDQVEELIAEALVPVKADVATALATANEALDEAQGQNVLDLLGISSLDGFGG